MKRGYLLELQNTVLRLIVPLQKLMIQCYIAATAENGFRFWHSVMVYKSVAIHPMNKTVTNRK